MGKNMPHSQPLRKGEDSIRQRPKTKMERTLFISKRDTSGKGASEERLQDKDLKAAIENALQKYRKCSEKLKGEEGCHHSCLEVTS